MKLLGMYRTVAGLTAELPADGITTNPWLSRIFVLTYALGMR